MTTMLPLKNLRKMLTIRNRMDQLTTQYIDLAQGLDTNGTTRTGSRHISAAGRKSIAKAQKKRWAAFHRSRKSLKKA